MEAKLNSFFNLSERKTSVSQEIRAGVTTFLTMSYILLVNPQILSLVGLKKTDVVVSTALAAGAASITSGILGNLPVGLASGVGLSVYLTYGLCIGAKYTPAKAFTCCLVAGLLLGVLAITGATAFIMRVIPRSVKIGITCGMGLLVALVGMTSVNIVVSNPDTIVGLGPMVNSIAS